MSFPKGAVGAALATAPAPVVSAGSETTVVPRVNVQVLAAGPFFKLTTTVAPAAPSIELSMSSTSLKI